MIELAPEMAVRLPEKAKVDVRASAEGFDAAARSRFGVLRM